MIRIAWSDNGLGAQPNGTRGIDQFIGEADMIGCGHGSALIRGFIDRLLTPGTPRVVTDPAPTNVRAVRAYEKASFEKIAWWTHPMDAHFSWYATYDRLLSPRDRLRA